MDTRFPPSELTRASVLATILSVSSTYECFWVVDAGCGCLAVVLVVVTVCVDGRTVLEAVAVAVAVAVAAVTAVIVGGGGGGGEAGLFRGPDVPSSIKAEALLLLLLIARDD